MVNRVWLLAVCGHVLAGGLSAERAQGVSPRTENERATTGAFNSNVKVEDISTLAPPAAPVIVTPIASQTLASTVGYVQWTGENHTMYQMQINVQNTPDATVIFDSQQISSNRFFAWTGTLSNNATYYAFVRLASAEGWGPWSVGRQFSVNTSFVPGGIDYVQVKGSSLANNNGPFLGLGFSHFRAMHRVHTNLTRYNSDLTFMASKGYNYQRILTMVAWDDLEIAPVAMTNGAGQAVAAWPNYAQEFKDCIDIAYSYGIKTEVTIFADAQHAMPSKATRITHINNLLSYIVGREHKIAHIEVANEAWQNGFPGSTGEADLREFCTQITNATPIPTAISSPSNTSDSGIVGLYSGSSADLTTVHFSRNVGTNEGGWLPVRDSWRTGVSTLAPMTSNEPIGPGSSVNTENDPIKLCMSAIFAWTANLPAYVFHCKAGVQSWTNCCPPSGTEAFFNTTTGVDCYEDILPLLPKDLSSWERNDGKVTASPFTNYSMGQANKWWTEVGGATNGCVRNIAGVKGGEFVTCPIGILSGGLELEARRPMSFLVYNPLTGATAYNLTKNTGEHFTLAQGTGAYVIKGFFTDVVGPATEVSIDLGSPDVQQGMTHPQVGDGDTTPSTIGGRTGRVNINPVQDYYFYFGVADAFAYQGNKPDIYILADYYDSGTITLMLEYDATADPSTGGGGVTLTNTNTWKTKVWHVTDAYFGNRQNGGADFRIGSVGNTFYLDNILVTTVAPGVPMIEEVSPDPLPVFPGVPYTQQLALTQGSPAPTWSVVSGPAGLQVNSLAMVTGWTPSVIGDYQLEIQAANSQGSDTESWTVRVLSHYDYDFDGDVDSSDFGHLQKCYSGVAIPYSTGCENGNADGDNDVDIFDFNLFLPCMLGPGTLPGC